MEGVALSIVLAVLLVMNYYIIKGMTSGIANQKLRSLIMSITNFVLVLLFIMALPMIGGYSYYSFQDMIDTLFNERTGVTLIMAIVGFIIAIVYFAVGAYSTWKVDTAKRKTAETKQKVDEIICLYTPLNIGASGTAARYQVDPEYINKEIVSAVRAFKEEKQEIYEKYDAISREQKSILSRAGFHSVNDKFSYLCENLDRLNQLKYESDRCLAQLFHKKVELLNENQDLLLELKCAFAHLQHSEKCISYGPNINDFVSTTRPCELVLFKFDNEPVILSLEQYSFCLFSNVILVFDNTGLFSTAIDPSAIKAIIKRENTSVMISNGNAAANEYVDEDSRCISHGAVKTTWLHTCLNGSPDLRYSYNPKIEYHVDTYVYMVVQFEIANRVVSFSASSYVVGAAFDSVIPKYFRKCNNRHNPIPELVHLIKLLDADMDSQTSATMSACIAKAIADGFFCKLTAA